MVEATPEDTETDEQGKTDALETTAQDSELYPDWEGEAPVNYRELRESVALAMQANEDIDNGEIDNIIGTVDNAVVQNEHQLSWENGDEGVGC